MADQPTPFTIVRSDTGAHPPVATNGAVRLMCLDADGQLSLRRGISGMMAAPMVEKILPQLNALAGELLANSAMDPAEIAARLHALQLACRPPEQRNIEWAYAELDGVRVYVDGADVIVTRQDLLLANG